MTAHPFTDLTTITAVGDGTFTATIDPVWTIGPKVHGGCMMAVCAAAAQQAIGPSELAPIAVSANYLNAPDPGEVQLTTTVRKHGRQVALVDVQLSQGGRAAVSCAVTLGPLDAKPPRYQESLAVSYLPVEPPADAVPVSAGHPVGELVHVAQGCEFLLDAATPFLSGEEGDPVNRMWLRPFASDEANPSTALLFALMAGDITPPGHHEPGPFRLDPDGATHHLCAASAGPGLAASAGQLDRGRRDLVRGRPRHPRFHRTGRGAEPAAGDAAQGCVSSARQAAEVTRYTSYTPSTLRTTFST